MSSIGDNSREAACSGGTKQSCQGYNHSVVIPRSLLSLTSGSMTRAFACWRTHVLSVYFYGLSEQLACCTAATQRSYLTSTMSSFLDFFKRNIFIGIFWGNALDIFCLVHIPLSPVCLGQATVSYSQPHYASCSMFPFLFSWCPLYSELHVINLLSLLHPRYVATLYQCIFIPQSNNLPLPISRSAILFSYTRRQ